MSELIGLAIFGLIVGIIAKLILPGKDPGGIIVTALIGMAGSLIGTFVGRNFLGYKPGESAGWIMSIIGTVLLLILYRVFTSKRA